MSPGKCRKAHLDLSSYPLLLLYTSFSRTLDLLCHNLLLFSHIDKIVFYSKKFTVNDNIITVIIILYNMFKYNVCFFFFFAHETNSINEKQSVLELVSLTCFSGCESLKKLDLTVNFVGELTSVECLKNLYNFREL